MVKLIDLTGQRFGKWTVLDRAADLTQPNGQKVARWHCRCDCGTERDVSGTSLKQGQSKSCGCTKNGTPLILKSSEECCVFNESVICGEQNCRSCGWNPDNYSLQRKRVNEVWRSKKKPTREKKAPETERTYKVRQVYCVELEQTFPTALAASKATGVSPISVHDCLIGKKASAKGFHFIERSCGNGE